MTFYKVIPAEKMWYKKIFEYMGFNQILINQIPNEIIKSANNFSYFN